MKKPKAARWSTSNPQPPITCRDRQVRLSIILPCYLLVIFLCAKKNPLFLMSHRKLRKNKLWYENFSHDGWKIEGWKSTPFSISQIPPTNHHGAHTPPNLQVIIPSHSEFSVEKVISSITSVNISFWAIIQPSRSSLWAVIFSSPENLLWFCCVDDFTFYIHRKSADNCQQFDGVVRCEAFSYA